MGKPNMTYPQFALDWLEGVNCKNMTYFIHFYKVVKPSKHFLWAEKQQQIISPEQPWFSCCHILIQNDLILFTSVVPGQAPPPLGALRRGRNTK